MKLIITKFRVNVLHKLVCFVFTISASQKMIDVETMLRQGSKIRFLVRFAASNKNLMARNAEYDIQYATLLMLHWFRWIITTQMSIEVAIWFVKPHLAIHFSNVSRQRNMMKMEACDYNSKSSCIVAPTISASLNE